MSINQVELRWLILASERFIEAVGGRVDNGFRCGTFYNDGGHKGIYGHLHRWITW